MNMYREAFINFVRVMKSAELKDKFLLEGFMAFCVSLVFLPTSGKYNQIICRGQA